RLHRLFHDERAMKRQPLAPRGHQNDLGDLALTIEAAPHRTRRRVVLFLLREGPINADDDVVAGRKLVVGVSRWKMPPLSGTGICCRPPIEKYGPSSALMRATSRAPNRSGHINVPSRSSSSSSGNFSP